MRKLLCTAVMVCVVTGCWGDGWKSVPDNSDYAYSVSPDGSVIAVTHEVSGCSEFRYREVKAREGSTEVVLRVRAEWRPPPAGISCAASIGYLTKHVHLQTPVGSRTVVMPQTQHFISCADGFRAEGLSGDSCEPGSPASASP
ncbi:hypothetical protein IEE94_13205 [Yimella sp. cx-573]|nr:hypothetical protein [Yimella sp. cx-573]